MAEHLTKLYRVADSREHVVDNPASFCLESGPANVFAQSIAPTASGLTQVTFQLQPAGPDTLLNRDVTYVVSGTVPITITPTNNWAAGPALPSDGLVGFAESAALFVQSESVNLASCTETVYPQDCWSELARINSPSKVIKSYAGGGATLLDSFQSLTNIDAGSPANPLLTGSDVVQSDCVCLPRGQGVFVTTNPVVAANQTPANIVLSFNFRFKSFIDFFRSQAGARAGLRGQTNYTITLNLNSILNLFKFSLPGAYAITAAAVPVLNWACEVTWLTPGPEEAIPWAAQVVEYGSVQRWVQQFSSSATAGQQMSCAINNIYTDVIPDMLIFSATPTAYLSSPSGSNCNYPMVFMPPAANQQITFNNATVLSNLNTNQLYEMSRRNGYSQCLEIFRGDVAQSIGGAGFTTAGGPTGIVAGAATTAAFQGGFMVCRPSRDFGISNTELAGGVKSGWSMSGTLNFFNTMYQAAPNNSYTLHIIAVTSSKLVLTPGGAVSDKGVCSKEEYLHLKIMQPHHLTSDQMQDYSDGYGGAFWSNVGNFFKKSAGAAVNAGKAYLAQAAKDPLGTLRGISNVASMGAKYVPQLSGAAGLLGRAADFVGAGDGGAMLDRRHHTVAQKKALARAYLGH